MMDERGTLVLTLTVTKYKVNIYTYRKQIHGPHWSTDTPAIEFTMLYLTLDPQESTSCTVIKPNLFLPFKTHCVTLKIYGMTLF